MALVYGCVVPHPPIMVPEVGRGREREISATLEAMARVRDELERCRPEALLVISPHGVMHEDAMGVLNGPFSFGSLDLWGAAGITFEFDNSSELVQALTEEAEAQGLPLRSIAEEAYELDHGITAPLYFLRPAVESAPLVPLAFSWLPLQRHIDFGRVIRQAAQRSGKRTALVASGDLSHRLTPGAPAGFSPLGHVFDKEVCSAVAALDAGALVNMDPGLITAAGECGLRSIVILLGAVEGLAERAEVLSYEGPFGVGYLAASVEIQEE